MLIFGPCQTQVRPTIELCAFILTYYDLGWPLLGWANNVKACTTPKHLSRLILSQNGRHYQKHRELSVWSF